MASGQLSTVIRFLHALVAPRAEHEATDSHLLKRFAAQRDEAAFTALLQRHGPMVWGVCERVLRNSHDAEDAFQATFLVLVRKAGSVSPPELLGNWLYGVAYRTALKARAEAARRRAHERQVVDMAEGSASVDAVWTDLRPVLDEEVSRLPDRFRVPFVLCYLQGRTNEEAARLLGCPKGTVLSRLARARERLRVRLTRRGLTLSVTALPIALSANAASATVPAGLMDSTMKVAMLAATGKAAATGLVSTKVAGLTEGVLKSMLLTKLKIAAAWLLVIAALGTGASGFGALLMTGQTSDPKQANDTDAREIDKTIRTRKAVANEDKKTGAIHGVIKDSDGRLLAGATVVLHRVVGQDRPAVARTAADGSFSFPSLPDASNYSLTLVVAHEGSGAAIAYAREDRDVTVNLTLPKASSASGIVTDRNGRPIAGARVQFGTVTRSGNGSFWSYVPKEAVSGTPLEQFFETHTDAGGKFRFTTVPADQELIFRVTADGFAELDTGSEGPKGKHFARADAAPAALVLVPEARLEGRVVSRIPGIKMDGRTLWLQPTGRQNQGFSKYFQVDSSGRFSGRGLPEGSFLVQLDDSKDEASWTLRAAAEVSLRPGVRSDVNLELIEGTVVEGKVVAAKTGQPVAGVIVGAHSPARPAASQASDRAHTDGQGRYRLRLPPGRADLYVFAAPGGYMPPPREQNTGSLLVPDHAANAAGPTLTVVPAAALVPLEGRVVDVRGRPVPQAEIIGLCRAGTCVRVAGQKVVTDTRGHFRIDQGPDGAFPLGEATSLEVQLPGGKVFEVRTIAARGQVEVQLPTLADGKAKGPDDVRPTELAGVVVDDQGQPLEGVHVHVWDWVDSPDNQTRTGQDGVFRLKDCERDHKVQVRFRKPGYSPVMFVQQPVGVKGLVVAMDSKTYFEGTVRGPDGKPAANALIRANQGPKMGDGVGISTVWTDTRSDASGRYRLYVEPDAYEFLVKAAGVGVARLDKTPIAHGQARRFDIQLQPGITFQAVAVDSVTDKPIAGVRLWNWEHKDVEGRSSARGEITISEMLPGKFDFQVEAAGYTRWWSDDAISEWNRRRIDNPKLNWQRNFDYLDFNLKPGMAPVMITLEKGVRITGRVLDPDGKPVGGATAAPALTGTGNSLTGDARFSVETKADGTFDMLLPASGDARYNLVAHDGKYSEWRKWGNGVLPTIQTTPGQEIRDVVLKLTRPATVRGKVVDGQGKPVAFREVRAHAADKLENRYYDPTTTTKEDGSFELRFIRPGEQFIQAAPFWLAAEEAPDRSTRKLRLAAGETVDRIELVAADQPR